MGADSLIGGSGSGTYLIDNASGAILETANEGHDSVSTQLLSFTLGSHLENLSYGGVGNLTGIGNILTNAITGSALPNREGFADTLNSSGDADTLAGGI